MKTLFSTSAVALFLLFWLDITLISVRCTGNEPPSNDIEENLSVLDVYKNLFKVKRKDHIAALEHLLLMDSEEKQSNMITAMMKTITKTVTKAQETLKQENYKVNDSFPQKESIKDALSLVLENTALMTDLLVRFPIIAKRVRKTTGEELKTVFSKAREICRGSGVYDGDYTAILHSLGQELELDEKDENYENPFNVVKKEVYESSEERKKRHEAEKKKAKKKKSRKKKTEL